MGVGPGLWKSKPVLRSGKYLNFTDILCRGKAPQTNFVTSNQTSVREDIVYSKEDDAVQLSPICPPVFNSDTKG